MAINTNHKVYKGIQNQSKTIFNLGTKTLKFNTTFT
jgi:hypothetical protein